MKKNPLFLLLACLLLIGSSHAFSQKTDSLLGNYRANYRQEKIHIHFDRSLYTKGDTIWMKVYLMAGKRFF